MWKNKRAKHNSSSTGFFFTLFLPSLTPALQFQLLLTDTSINQFSDKLRKNIKSEDGSGGLLVETGFRANCYDEVSSPHCTYLL